MRNRRNIVILTLVVAGMIVLAAIGRQRLAAPSSAESNNVIFIDHYHLSGTYNQSLVVVANTISSGSAGDNLVQGDAALVSRGDIRFDGATTGDLTAMGSNIVVGGRVSGETSLMGDQIIINGHFSGPITVIGDSLTIEADATLDSPITACVDTIVDHRVQHQPVTPCQDKAKSLAAFVSLQALSGDFGVGRFVNGGGWTGGGLLFSLSVSLLLTGLAALAVTAFPGHFSHIQEAILTTPRDLAALGCITFLLALGIAAALVVALSVIPVLSIVIIPVGLLLGLLLLGMVIVGWMTLALLLGEFLIYHFKHTSQPPLVAVAVGSLSLFAIWHILALIPFGPMVGLLGMAALGCAGLGGTVATRLGTRSLRRQYFVQG